MEEGQATIQELTERMDLIKGEVDGLQTAVLEQHTPWYKNVATLISLIALLFSFGTTYVSYSRTKSQDIHSLRAELRVMLQRLASLPKENFDITKKYTDDPSGVQLLSGFINQENTLIVKQAADIVKRLPSDQVSSTEYYSIAVALQAAYNFDEAVNFLRLAIKAANDMNSEVGALRAYANTLFLTGQHEAGRVEYQKALGVFSKYKGYNDFTQKSSHIWTELGWAVSEASNGFAHLANQHIANAESTVSTLLPSPGTEQLKNQINQAKSMLASGKPPEILKQTP